MLSVARVTNRINKYVIVLASVRCGHARALASATPAQVLAIFVDTLQNDPCISGLVLGAKDSSYGQRENNDVINPGGKRALQSAGGRTIILTGGGTGEGPVQGQPPQRCAYITCMCTYIEHMCAHTANSQ